MCIRDRDVRVLVRTEVEERTTRTVPHLATLLVIDEGRELELVDAEARANRSGPVRIRIGDDAVRRIDDRESIGADVQRVLCLLYTSPSPRDGLLSRMPSS